MLYYVRFLDSYRAVRTMFVENRELRRVGLGQQVEYAVTRLHRG